MAEAFDFNACQVFDFTQELDNSPDTSFFEKEHEVFYTCTKRNDIKEVIEIDDSDAENEYFFSPSDTKESSNAVIHLRSTLRRSLSLNNLPRGAIQTENEASPPSDVTRDENADRQRPNSACSFNPKSRVASKEHINRLAQPKRFTSQDNLNNSTSMTLAEAVVKFQAGTPKRFRSKLSPRQHKMVSIPKFPTKPHTPNFATTRRTRPVTVVSQEEKEQQEIEEAKKFKIRARPVNKKVLRGPLKAQIDKKPVTVAEPFKLTEIKKKEQVKEAENAVQFKAQPIPKCLQKPFQVKPTDQAPTKAQSPKLTKRLDKAVPQLDKTQIVEKPKPARPCNTRPLPFTFEERDQRLVKKKQEFIKKVLEEEKKAREFHARPPPKAILRSRNCSLEKSSDAGSSGSFHRSTEEISDVVFKAKPATVLYKKPFEPKKEHHVVKVEEFNFNTDRRHQARQEFEEKLKLKEQLAAKLRREREERLKKQQEEEVVRLRKQMEVKAQPIKKYKELVIQPSNKVTEPISFHFHTDKGNKENNPCTSNGL